MSSEELKQEEDKINTPKIIMIGVASLVTFLLGTWWAVVIQRDEMGTIVSDRSAKAEFAGQTEIGMVYQPTFDSRNLANERTAPKREWLNSYGWADKEKKIAHIPIERAIELTVEKGKL